MMKVLVFLLAEEGEFRKKRPRAHSARTPNRARGTVRVRGNAPSVGVSETTARQRQKLRRRDWPGARPLGKQSYRHCRVCRDYKDKTRPKIDTHAIIRTSLRSADPCGRLPIARSSLLAARCAPQRPCLCRSVRSPPPPSAVDPIKSSCRVPAPSSVARGVYVYHTFIRKHY